MDMQETKRMLEIWMKTNYHAQPMCKTCRYNISGKCSCENANFAVTDSWACDNYKSIYTIFSPDFRDCDWYKACGKKIEEWRKVNPSLMIKREAIANSIIFEKYKDILWGGAIGFMEPSALLGCIVDNKTGRLLVCSETFTSISENTVEGIYNAFSYAHVGENPIILPAFNIQIQEELKNRGLSVVLGHKMYKYFHHGFLTLSEFKEIIIDPIRCPHTSRALAGVKEENQILNNGFIPTDKEVEALMMCLDNLIHELYGWKELK